MRYLKDEDILLISVRDFVSAARRLISPLPPCDEDEPISNGSPSHEREYPVYDFTIENYRFRMTEVTPLEDGRLNVAAEMDTTSRKPKKETVMQARGEGYISAYVNALHNSQSEIQISYSYLNKSNGTVYEESETVKFSELEKFFNRCKKTIIVYAKPEIERVTERLSTMKKVKFPFKNVRSGQGDLVKKIYNNIARGGTLLVSAPTGTGKTVSVLFPAIRALGDERCNKIFYLTPKTTTANAAMDTLCQIKESGAEVRAVLIRSKESTCQNGLVCRRVKNKCENRKANKLTEATLSLYEMRKAVIGPAEIQQTASEFCVCPHELSLSYAEICDVVILDFNYLFDPKVYLRRFFTSHGKYTFLIDEAHNLADRAREMYSSTLPLSLFSSLFESPLIGDHSPIKKLSEETFSSLNELFHAYLKDDIYTDESGNKKGACHLSEVPDGIYITLEKCLVEIEDEIFRSRGARDGESEERTQLLRDSFYRIKEIYEALLRFTDSYELFIFLENESLTLRCCCLDPSREITKKLELGDSAVFFSGTLSPISYYKSVLLGNKSAEIFEIDSPFDSGQLCVNVMDKISTRYSERERTVDTVVKAIAATVSVKKGNYMVFSPSFEYLETIAKHFSYKYPKINTLVQSKGMSKKEKEDFILKFKSNDKSYLIGFSVLGGIYSEGIDFSGESLIGAIIVGIGIPSLSYEREAMAAYYQDKFEEGKQYAYIYPGINKVLQAAGRVIRSEEDRGVIVLIDDRFDDPLYKKVIPKLWKGMHFTGSAKELNEDVRKFWEEQSSDK